MIRDDPDACVEAALHWEGLRQIEDSMKMSQRKPAHKARINISAVCPRAGR